MKVYHGSYTEIVEIETCRKVGIIATSEKVFTLPISAAKLNIGLSAWESCMERKAWLPNLLYCT